MKVDRQQLIDVLESVRPGLATRECLEQSTSFVFMEGRVYTFNDSVAMNRPMDVGFTGAVMARELCALLNKLKDKEVELKSTGTELIVKGDKVKAGIKMAEDILLPINEIQEPEDGDWEDAPKGFTEAIRFCHFNCSRDISNPLMLPLTCVHAYGNKVESSDNYRITIREVEGMDFQKHLMLPAEAAKDVIKYKIARIALLDEWLHFETADGIRFSVRAYEGATYPDVSGYTDVDGKKLKFPEKMRESLSLAEIFSKTISQGDERVRIVLEKGEMVLRGEGDMGWVEKKSRVRYQGEKTVFEIVPAFLDEVLALCDVAVVGEKMLKFEGDGFIHVVGLLEG